MLSRYKNSYLSYVIFYVGYYAVFSVFGSVLAVYLAGLGLGDREVSLVLSAGGIFSLAITPISGWLHDRSKSQKQVLTVTLCLIALLAMAFSACRSVGLLFLLGGMVNALVNSVTPVCERVAGSSRYRYGLLRVWGTIGYAMGAQAAGLAIERLPSWAPFALTAGSCGLCLLGLWGAQVSPPPQKTSATAGKKPRLRELGKSPQFFLFLGAGLIFTPAAEQAGGPGRGSGHGAVFQHADGNTHDSFLPQIHGQALGQNPDRGLFCAGCRAVSGLWPGGKRGGGGDGNGADEGRDLHAVYDAVAENGARHCAGGADHHRAVSGGGGEQSGGNIAAERGRVCVRAVGRWDAVFRDGRAVRRGIGADSFFAGAE